MIPPDKNIPADDLLIPDTKTQPRPAEGSPATPYGPHPFGVDEAAGGADSSPHETEPTAEPPDESSP